MVIPEEIAQGAAELAQPSAEALAQPGAGALEETPGSDQPDDQQGNQQDNQQENNEQQKKKKPRPEPKKKEDEEDEAKDLVEATKRLKKSLDGLRDALIDNFARKNASEEENSNQQQSGNSNQQRSDNTAQQQSTSSQQQTAGRTPAQMTPQPQNRGTVNQETVASSLEDGVNSSSASFETPTPSSPASGAAEGLDQGVEAAGEAIRNVVP